MVKVSHKSIERVATIPS